MEFLKRMYGEHPHSQYLSISLSKNRTFLFVRCKIAAFSCIARAFELRVLIPCSGKSGRARGCAGAAAWRGNTHLILGHVTLLAHERIQLRCQRRLGRHPSAGRHDPPTLARSLPRALSRALLLSPARILLSSSRA